MICEHPIGMTGKHSGNSRPTLLTHLSNGRGMPAVDREATGDLVTLPLSY